MIHTYLCRAPRTTTTGTTTDGASTVLPTNPLFLSLSLSLSHTHTHTCSFEHSHSRFVSLPFLFLCSSLAFRTRLVLPPLMPAWQYGGPGRKAGRQPASQPASQPPGTARVPLAFARSGLLIRTRRCASRARAVSTLPLKITTRMPRETKA